MEGTLDGFVLVAGQHEYDASDGLNADVVSIDYLYRESVPHVPIEPRSLGEVRSAIEDTQHAFWPHSPAIYCWHHQKLILTPIVPGLTILGDYLKDAKRDATTGALITEDDTTTTNPWFEEGEDILRCRVLLDFYASFARDENSVRVYSALYGQGLADARALVTSQRTAGVRAPFSW
jgi:hypothetical protein